MGQSSSRIAASRVFAIPELVELIFLYLPWQRLFVLQRVNKTLSRVLSGSKPLQEKMAIHSLYDLSQGRRAPGRNFPSTFQARRKCSTLITLRQGFSWSSRFTCVEISAPHDVLTMKVQHVVRGRLTGDGNILEKIVASTWPRLLHFYQEKRGRPRRSSCGGISDAVGMGRRCLDHFHALDARGSWRRLKLTSFTNTIWVEVNVVLQDVSLIISGPLLYQDRVALSADKATFGDLADILHEVSERSLETHLKICDITRDDFPAWPDVDSVATMRKASRKKISAVIAWDGEEADSEILSREKERRKQNRKMESRMKAVKAVAIIFCPVLLVMISGLLYTVVVKFVSYGWILFVAIVP